jgi:LysM repeat protein
MFAVTVQPGDTLSGIAAAHGESLATVEADNPQFSDPNLIYVGQHVYIGGGSGVSSSSVERSAPAYTPPSPSSTSYHSSSGGSGGSGGLYDIPGMPSGLAHCIAYRESTDDTNPAANGNAYGIIPASGYNVAGDSIAQQNQVAGEIYAQSGGAAWAADGCPGT